MAHSLNPQDIDAENWYYEEQKGLTLIHLHAPGVTCQIVIPWKLVSASIRRHLGRPNQQLQPTASRGQRAAKPKPRRARGG